MRTSDTETTIQIPPQGASRDASHARPAAQVRPLPWWSAASLLALAGVLAALTWGGIQIARLPAAPAEIPTTIFITVTPQVTQAAAPNPEATPTPPLSLRPGGLVQIISTGGMGVRLRDGPGLLYQTRKIVPEGSQLELSGEARQADGYLWWPVRSLSDGEQGWMVADYLRAINAP